MYPAGGAWVIFTFYADRYDADDVIHRLLILSGMLSIIFLAANVPSAFKGGSLGFTLSYVVVRSIVLTLYIRATRHVPVAWANLKLYLTSYIPSTCLWIISIVTPIPIRYILWGVAMVVELLSPILGSRLLARTPVHPSHLPERFGLLTLIVLGEAIVSVATGTSSTHWNLIPTLAAVGGFAIAACLWWLYFNFLENSVVIDNLRSVHIYNYGHLPIIMGLTLVAVGIQNTIQQAHLSVLSTGTRLTLCGGVALYMVSIGIIWIAACQRRFSWLLVGAVAIALVLAIAGGSLPPLVLESLLLAMLLGKVSIDIFANQAWKG